MKATFLASGGNNMRIIIIVRDMSMGGSQKVAIN